MVPSLESKKVPGARRFRRWPRAILGIALALAAAAVAARLAAPGYVQRAINRRLSQIPGYAGHVGDIGLHLWRGAYRIDNIELIKSSGEFSEPFFAAKRIDFSVAWLDVFHGRFVSDIHVEDGRLVFLRGPTE